MSATTSPLALVFDRATVNVRHGSGTVQAAASLPDSLVHGYNRNGNAIAATGSGARVTATRSTIADYATGFQNSGAAFYSTGDNTINNCAANTSGTITTLAQH